MGPLLHSLVKLQSVENRLRASKSKLTRCRRAVIFQENQLRNLQNELESKLEEIKLTKIQSDRLELELKDRDAHIAKYRAALNLAKTNKEYAALLTELNTSKADNVKIETQALELLRNIETDEADCGGMKQQIEEQKGKLEEIRAATEEKTVVFETEIKTVQAEWDEAAKDVPADTLEIFKRTADTYDGEAIAVAELQNDRSEVYSCGGCFMTITSESVNQLMTKDDIYRCGSCSRILVLKADEA
jgi:predicted  nucleic acid-binding Zn-ribbon protein